MLVLGPPIDPPSEWRKAITSLTFAVIAASSITSRSTASESGSSCSA